MLTLWLMNAHAQDLSIPHEHYELANGLDVILVEDHSLPQVVVNLWYDVGSSNEVKGRTGFAHLFEHLMFMGTDRVPGSGFDMAMEAHGGWNNAWTSEDATDYYEVGPPNLLETLLWLEADRLESLGASMTQDKLDLQRDVVRNERRQSYENAPYGKLWLELPAAMYPEGHPYAHPVIGSHEDLIAAQVSDVTDFFSTWYVPNNASLVVAGDFDPEAIKPVIERMFGHIPAGELPETGDVPAVDTPQKARVEVTDKVQIPLGVLAWHSPAALKAGDAEMDLVASVLAGGRASRLYRRLVDSGLALEVDASQFSQDLGSLFLIDFKPTEGNHLDALQEAVFEELSALASEGPSDDELERAINGFEMDFLHKLESLHSRASALNRYNVAVGDPDWLAQDLARYRNATTEGVRAAAALLTAERASSLRVLPESAE